MNKTFILIAAIFFFLSAKPMKDIHNYVIHNKPNSVTSYLTGGGDPNVVNDTGRTPIFYAFVYRTNPNIPKDLLKHGADINYQDLRGNTVLHLKRPGHNNIEVVKFLIKNGADIYIKNIKGETPIDLASSLYVKNVMSLDYGVKKICDRKKV